MNEESYLLRKIEAITRAYMRDLEPYHKRLAEIEALKPMKPIIVSGSAVPTYIVSGSGFRYDVT